MRARPTIYALLAVAAAAALAAAPERFSLTSTDGLKPQNVVIAPAKLAGKAGLRVTMTDAARERWLAMSPDDRQRNVQAGDFEQLVVIEGLEFGDGVIEAEIAGEAQTSVFEGARGFVGIAFRVQPDLRAYDAFYLRPTNGRADDQLRRNHSTQYISHPDWTWFRLRQEFPGKYESYVDLVPGEWTKIRIEVRGDRARLFVHDAKEPALIVNDLRSGKAARGAVALWLDIGTVAHFRNLSVKP